MNRGLNRRLAILEAASQAPASNSGCSAKAELVDRLERMVVDVRAQPGWREPTSPESAASLAAIKAYLTEQFGWREPPPEAVERATRRYTGAPASSTAMASTVRGRSPVGELLAEPGFTPTRCGRP